MESLIEMLEKNLVIWWSYVDGEEKRIKETCRNRGRSTGLADFSNLLIKGGGKVLSSQEGQGRKRWQTKKWRNNGVELVRIMCRGIQLSLEEGLSSCHTEWEPGQESIIMGDQYQVVISAADHSPLWFGLVVYIFDLLSLLDGQSDVFLWLYSYSCVCVMRFMLWVIDGWLVCH